MMHSQSTCTVGELLTRFINNLELERTIDGKNVDNAAEKTFAYFDIDAETNLMYEPKDET